MPGIFQSLLSGPVLSWQITLCSHSHIHTGHTHTTYSHTTAWIKPWSGSDSRKGGLILLTCIRDWPQESPMWLGVKGSQPEGWSWPAAIMLFLNLISDQRHAYHICSSICETDLKTGTTSIANSLKKCWNYGIPGNCHFHKCSNVLSFPHKKNLLSWPLGDSSPIFNVCTVNLHLNTRMVPSPWISVLETWRKSMSPEVVQWEKEFGASIFSRVIHSFETKDSTWKCRS